MNGKSCAPRVLCAALLMAAMRPATAQIGIPPVQLPLPDLPAPLPAPLPAVLPAANEALQAPVQTLRQARQAGIRILLRDNRDILEADPAGAPLRRAELLAFSPSAAALQAATAAGFELLRRQPLDLLGEVVVLRAPPGTTTRRALAQLRALDAGGSYDYNHLYLQSGAAASAGVHPGIAATPARADGARIGLIDGGIDPAHPALAHAAVTRSGCQDRALPSAHGTAVASLLVGDAPDFHGAAPGAQLFAADVYCGQATGGAVDELAAAFATLLRQRVTVINISLVGPRNAALEQLIRAVQSRGVLIVAAAGNDGPAAKPLYPAAFPGVVAVTAVDAQRRVLPEACRGAHVQFAAPGAAMLAADAHQGYVTVRGTSFAAPLVTGLLAALQLRPGADNQAVVQQLAQGAVDLGRRGRDPLYGFGLVGEELRVPVEGLPGLRR